MPVTPALSLVCVSTDRVSRLPAGPYPVVWKKGRRVISAGKTITAIDRRFRLVGQHDLEITRVRVKDAGTFTCSVSTEPLMELTHTVDILCE